MKTLPNDSNHVEDLKDLYREILEKQKKYITNISFIKVVIHIGIPRHISVMLDFINYLSQRYEFDTFTKSKLLECMISSKLDIDHELLGIDSNNVAFVKELLNKRSIFASQLCSNMCQLFKTHFQSTNHDVMRRILAQMDNCGKTCTTDEKKHAVAWLLSQVCRALEEVDPGATYEPILTGSAAECTQALFFDEFDYLLLTKKDLEKGRFQDRLQKMVSKMAKRAYHLRLSIDSLTVNCRGFYPCLNIEWVDEELRNTNISIDLILVVPLRLPVSLPHHNFLPVPRDHQPNDGVSPQRVSLQNQDTEIVDHGEGSTTKTKNVPRLFTELRELRTSDIVFSQIEKLAGQIASI